MPYKKTKDLPDQEKIVLPKHAKLSLFILKK